MPTKNLVETHNLTKQYGKIRCVNAVNMQVPPGAIYGFLGPNGAGKSSTLNPCNPETEQRRRRKTA